MPAYPSVLLLLGLVAAAETGLLAYLIDTFEASGYPAGQDTDDGPGSSNQMRVLIIYLLFVASWTTIFSLFFMCCVTSCSFTVMASIGTALLWLVVTIILWATATMLFHQVRIGGECIGAPAVSVCRQLEAVEALGWAALGLCVLTIIAAIFAWRRRSYRGSAYHV